jgi:hypothetical protein
MQTLAWPTRCGRPISGITRELAIVNEQVAGMQPTVFEVAVKEFEEAMNRAFSSTPEKGLPLLGEADKAKEAFDHRIPARWIRFSEASND